VLKALGTGTAAGGEDERLSAGEILPNEFVDVHEEED